MTQDFELTGENLTIAKKLLRDAAKILEKSNTEYCLEAGTLLGIVRENRLLPWDNDMDMSIAETRYSRLQLLAWKFRFHGYWARVRRVKRDLPHVKQGTVRVLRIRNRRFKLIAGPVKLDIFIRHPAKDGYRWIEGYTGKEITLYTPKKYFVSTIQTKFDGHEYWIPENFDEYLTYRYGEWRIPQKDWDHLTDDGAIVWKSESEGSA